MPNQDEHLISVRIAPSRLEASLVVNKGIDRAYVTAEVILAKALSQALRSSPQLTTNISAALELFATHDLDTMGDFTVPLDSGKPAEDGTDGTFILEPELEAIHALSRHRAQPDAHPKPKGNEEQTLDHHSRSTIMIVKAGQRVGTMTKATEGADGIDVAGNIIRAKPGKSVPIKFDAQSVECHDSGAIIAKIAGQLHVEHEAVHISPSLSIEGYVDYSTGNIDFPGNIEVRKGVRDCFHINSGKSVTIGGLVEAADLVSARDISLMGGIAGREKGTVHAGRDLVARYLNGCQCRVGRNLVVEKEICDCKVAVSGSVVSPSATVMGGVLASLGPCEVAQVGSNAGAHTVISLGRAETLDGLVAESLAIIKKLGDKAAAAKAQIAELRSDPDSSSLKAEMMTTLQFEIAELDTKISPLKDSLKATLTLINSKSEPMLRVHELLCHGSEIRAGGFKAQIIQSIKGPLAVSLDAAGEMICTDLTSGSATPLKTIAKMSPDESSYNRSDLPSELRKSA